MAKTAKKTRKRTVPKAAPQAARPVKAPPVKAPPVKAPPVKAQPVARPESPAREPGTRPAFLRGLFAGAGAAMTLSMIVTMAAFAFTDTFSPSARGAAAAAGTGAAPAAARPPGAIIEASTETTGKLALTVRATVTDRRYQPIKGARPVVTLDMVQMPQAHRTAPVAMAPVTGSPGTYQAKVVAPMNGAFDVTVQLDAPQRGEAHTRVTLPAG